MKKTHKGEPHLYQRLPLLRREPLENVLRTFTQKCAGDGPLRHLSVKITSLEVSKL